MKKIPLLLVLCFLIASCSTYQKLALKPGYRSQTLNIDFQTHPSIPAYFANELNSRLEAFIKSYNSKGNRFIIDSHMDSSNKLNIRVQSVQIVNE
ncbi:MAG: hypothetical protein ACKOC0_01525, partial [Cytophagales bacterium]